MHRRHLIAIGTVLTFAVFLVSIMFFSWLRGLYSQWEYEHRDLVPAIVSNTDHAALLSDCRLLMNSVGLFRTESRYLKEGILLYGTSDQFRAVACDSLMSLEPKWVIIRDGSVMVNLARTRRFGLIAYETNSFLQEGSEKLTNGLWLYTDSDFTSEIHGRPSSRAKQ
jgi:hypothetical protein